MIIEFLFSDHVLQSSLFGVLYLSFIFWAFLFLRPFRKLSLPLYLRKNTQVKVRRIVLTHWCAYVDDNDENKKDLWFGLFLIIF